MVDNPAPEEAETASLFVWAAALLDGVVERQLHQPDGRCG